MQFSNAELFKLLKSKECPDATSPIPQSPVFNKGLGNRVWDANGKEYLDFISGFGALPLGHNHPKILSHIQEELQNGGLCQGFGDLFANQPKVLYLDLILKQLPPSLDRGMFSVTGSQAVEGALKTAILATQASGFITFSGGYHGVDLGVLPFTHQARFKNPFDSLLAQNQVVSLPFNCDEATLLEGLAELQNRGIKTAGILVEPLQGRAGYIESQPGFLAMLRRIATQQNLCLIFDEVFTGFGRTGQFSYAHEVCPDILCLGKAIGGGMPLSGCFANQSIMQHWPDEPEAIHTGTFFGHPLACQYGYHTLQTMLQDKLLDRVKQLSPQFTKILKSKLQDHSAVKNIRSTGFIFVIEFNEAGKGAQVMEMLLQEGILVLPAGPTGECISLIASYITKENEIEQAAHAIHRILNSSEFTQR